MKINDKNAIYNHTKLKPLLYFIGNALFAFLISKSIVNGSHTFSSFAGLAFFGAGSIVFLILLIPGSSYLKLTDEGFQCCYAYRRRKFIPWGNITTFQVFTVFTGVFYRKGVGYKLVNGDDENRLITLPDNYGFKPDELSKFMNQRLEEFKAIANTRSDHDRA